MNLVDEAIMIKHVFLFVLVTTVIAFTYQLNSWAMHETFLECFESFLAFYVPPQLVTGLALRTRSSQYGAVGYYGAVGRYRAREGMYLWGPLCPD